MGYGRATNQPVLGEAEIFFGLAKTSLVGSTDIESHNDIGANVDLRSGGDLGSEEMLGAVEAGGELYSLVGNGGIETENLVAAGVGEQGVGPVHETMEATQSLDVFGSRAQIQMIVIGEDNLGMDTFQVSGREGLDGGVSAHGHEDGSGDVSMRSMKDTGSATTGKFTFDFEARHEAHYT